MPNNYFQFKLFKINQDKTAMKVGTDGVLLGAWTNCNIATKVLDVGTGTGLIALMMAQRSKAMIEAVEIEINAWLQAKTNFENSPWAYRLKVENASFQSYCDKGLVKIYDLIVCNPPFFNNSYKPESPQREIARHSILLSPLDLVSGVNQLLKDEGLFSVILPFSTHKEFIEIAEKNDLFCCRITIVRPLPNLEPHRVLMEFRKQQINCIENSLCIETGERHQYSADYIELTKDFYLNF
ncbi:MAG: methyltransferase [Bacteroidales bacterium]|nr:methyltransferase [Bacteroidales bacterium]